MNWSLLKPHKILRSLRITFFTRLFKLRYVIIFLSFLAIPVLEWILIKIPGASYSTLWKELEDWNFLSMGNVGLFSGKVTLALHYSQSTQQPHQMTSGVCVRVDNQSGKTLRSDRTSLYLKSNKIHFLDTLIQSFSHLEIKKGPQGKSLCIGSFI